jgi:hypothetical protein
MSLEEAILDKVRRLPPPQQDKYCDLRTAFSKNTSSESSRPVIAGVK